MLIPNFFVFQTHMHSYLVKLYIIVGLSLYLLPSLSRLCRCTGSTKLPLLACAISTKISILFAYWIFFHAFLSFDDFFQNLCSRKILSGIPSECQTVWTQIRTDVLSVLIWVQIVCKGYQQTTLIGKELN